MRATFVLVLLLGLVAAGFASWRYDLLDDRLDALLGTGGPDGTSTPAGDPTTDPAAVAPPPGLDLPDVTAPRPVARPASPSGRLDPAAVRRALAPYVRDRDLGRHVRALVTPLDAAPGVLSLGKGMAIPASTTKLVTATAALLALGPDHVFTTSTRLGPVTGARADLTLVGGGDPFLERTPRTPDGEAWPYPPRADVTTLAASTAEALAEQDVRRVRLSYDDSLFTGPALNPRWEPGYLPVEVGPTSALWVDAARTLDRFARVTDPGRETADVFAAALRVAGVVVLGDPVAARAPARSQPLSRVDSAPLEQIVQRILDVSDNDGAEVLLRQVGIAQSAARSTGRSAGGSIEAGRRAVRTLLAGAGAPLGASTLYDGSGLSRADRIEPALLGAVLRLAADPSRPGLRAVVEGLPVAGFTGSLRTRMDAGPPAGLGRVRAKTGTLTGVSSLAGIGTDLDGTPFVFVLMADAIKPLDSVDARQTLDSAAAALGACRCTR